ncbi:MAG: rod shape-determining protein RodA [Cetobacterium sp.]|uniref:rod shape-determining protein RodA n=1 Tax=unclassified Cetobacterium TaxID=2630983 RepID=UPI00163C3768|nr:rod shape-determining protein RodA [Cetobacterium sp. 2A]MBC2855889.1 rod shape-determining protein RodA [Cetobacterium sp. 2A]
MGKNRDTTLVLKKIKKMKLGILITALAIVFLSMMTVYSATSHKTISYFYKELVWSGLGVVVYFIFSFIDYRVYGKYYKVIYIFNIILLLSVYVIGDKRLGAQRWIEIGPFTIQPSEFAKLFVVLTLSELLATKYRDRFTGLKEMIMTGLYVLPIFILIAKQPDLGTAMVLTFVYITLIFVNGIDWVTIGVTLLSGVSMIPVAYFFFLKEYQRKRIQTFLNPEADMLGSGWNVTQSMIAIGSGGFYGRGFLQGTQSKLRFLPESHTDFIGSVFLEERGFVGGVILLVLYFLLVMQILKIGDGADRYGKLVCYGIAAIFFFHVVVNVGMIMGVMPVTGLPLLLMSYGGTSFMFCFMMLGIVQSVRIYKE